MTLREKYKDLIEQSSPQVRALIDTLPEAEVEEMLSTLSGISEARKLREQAEAERFPKNLKHQVEQSINEMKAAELVAQEIRHKVDPNVGLAMINAFRAAIPNGISIPTFAGTMASVLGFLLQRMASNEPIPTFTVIETQKVILAAICQTAGEHVEAHNDAQAAAAAAKAMRKATAGA